MEPLQPMDFKCPNEEKGHPDEPTIPLAEFMADKAKEFNPNLVGKDSHHAMDIRQGFAADQERLTILPPGTKYPIYRIYTDVCMVCGTYYVKRIEFGMGTTQAMELPPRRQGPPR